jgi:hypothetical protein
VPGRRSDASRRDGHDREAEAPSGSAEDALDVADGSPTDLGDLGNRHAVRFSWKKDYIVTIVAVLGTGRG